MNLDPIRSLARHTAVYSLGDFGGRSVGLILLPVYIRMLTTADNGLISVGFAFLGFSAVFYSLGLNQALIRYLSGVDEDHVRAGERFSTALVALLAVGVVVSSLTWTFASPIANVVLGSPDNADIVQMIAVIVFLDTLSEPVFTLCRARQQSTRYALIRLFQHAGQILLIAYLIVFEGAGVRAVFAANIASSVFALVAISPAAFGLLRPVFRPALLRDLLVFGLPFVPSAISALIISLSDRFLLEHYLGLDALGVYGVLFKFTIPTLLIVRAFRSAWAPGVLAVRDAEEARSVCARVTTYFVAAAGGLLLLVTGFGRDLILLVGGANAFHYLPGYPLLPILTLGHLLYGIYVILTAGVYAEGRTRMLPGVVAAGAGLNLAINLVMIPRIGYIAAAWSTLAANALMVALLYANTHRFYPVAYEFRRIGKAAIAAATVVLAYSWAPDDVAPAATATRGAVFLAYPVILWGWNFLRPGEWQDLRSLFARPAEVE